MVSCVPASCPSSDFPSPQTPFREHPVSGHCSALSDWLWFQPWLLNFTEGPEESLRSIESVLRRAQEFPHNYVTRDIIESVHKETDRMTTVLFCS